MTTSELTIKLDKHLINVRPINVTMYAPCTLVETEDTNKQTFLLFFYKNKYITALKLERLRKNSFVKKAFQKGITLPASHSLVRQLLPTDKPLKSATFQELCTYLEKNFPPHDAAVILTYFESFFPKKDLFQSIQSIFYELQRNGQTFETYRLLRLLLEFIPNHPWVADFHRKMEYRKYEAMYVDASDEIMQKDPFFQETVLFEDRSNRYDELVDLYVQQTRTVGLICLQFERVQTAPSPDTYHSFIQQVRQVPDVELIDVLERLLQHAPTLLEIQQDLLQCYFQLGLVHKAIQLIRTHQLLLPTDSLPQIERFLETLDLNTSFPDDIQDMFRSLIQLHSAKTELLLAKFVQHLLQTKGVHFTRQWLQPLNSESLQIIKKINKIAELQEDPDRQLELGELYYRLGLYEQAIECFQWEMELHETDIRPVRWLTKVYRKLGWGAEHDSYQQLSKDMLKRG